VNYLVRKLLTGVNVGYPLARQHRYMRLREAFADGLQRRQRHDRIADPVRGPDEYPLRVQRNASPIISAVGTFYSRGELVAAREKWKRAGKTVVFTNGCYDLLHPGHIRLLEQARSLGDILILALNTDASVSRFKGPNRPIIPESDRVEMTLALQSVDAVTLFDEDTPRELIAAVLPDVLVKGADWSHFIAGREEVEAAGGRVLPLPLEPGYSTTNLVDTILSRHS
jgi:rfaE bifunctional protein nucleotidyltransferase chain/domain